MKAIRKLQRHGSGYEIRIPPDVRKDLKARHGDYLVFDWEPGDGSAKLSKVLIREIKDVREKKA